ncbi:polyadenylate-binding protein-interacting protein 6 [Cinnamomum micranthum f. kanehirae]|uniref:Polyadenylate-binding protein-interacting protein 6 n=1 Tax=Cinnamomum micranthum f. kanehirae TaxID=337451 RepID=A0A3S3NDH3_9MAGN|nr:polyadenylate-binding protein-interacting protein 6 [Cinnamomum micranthum f. kanehirae]
MHLPQPKSENPVLISFIDSSMVEISREKRAIYLWGDWVISFFSSQERFSRRILLYSVDTMKPGMSSLNPYAAPFIPLSRQRTDNENIAPTTSENSKIYDPTACYNQVTESKTGDAKITFGDSILSDENPQHHLPNLATLNMNGSSIEGPTDSGVSLWKDCNAPRDYEDSMPQKADVMADRQSLIEDYELDLAYLAAAFPSISEQSLVDVYCANFGDLEASVDMLIQLEDLNIPDMSESSTVDGVSRIQNTTAYGESIGPSHPSCSGSGSQLQ